MYKHFESYERVLVCLSAQQFARPQLGIIDGKWLKVQMWDSLSWKNIMQNDWKSVGKMSILRR